MEKQTFHIEKMPFFQRFEGNDKAVISTRSFEKWLREVIGLNLKDRQDERQSAEPEKIANITELLNSIYQSESSAVEPVLSKIQAKSITAGDDNESW